MPTLTNAHQPAPQSRLRSLRTILTADLGAFPHAWEGLLTAYGRIPLRLDAWAEAIEVAYICGWE